MNLRRFSFNNYLALGIVIALATGCSSTEKRQRKEATAMRLFIESSAEAGDRSVTVPVYRASPIPITIERVPFLDEGHVIDAQVVDALGGFAIQIKFDFHGSLALESTTIANRGKRLVVACQFTGLRYLAAPVITTGLSGGVLTFTPDATREEAERIVRGLNNVATKLKNRPKAPKTKPQAQPANPEKK